MTEVRFDSCVAEASLKYVVIGAEMDGVPVWCRHRDRETWEMPGGHIEPGESPAEAAARELREETGAIDFDLEPVCIYTVVRDGAESSGMLFRAGIRSLGPLEYEIRQLAISPSPPGPWTYPDIQPRLLERLHA